MINKLDEITRIVNKYSDMIMRIAFQRTRNRSDAEDVVQEVLLTLFKEQIFSDEEHLKAWLIRVTVNKCKNLAKQRKRVAVPDGDSEYFGFSEENIDLMNKLDKLSEVDRDIIYLFYFEGYSAKETADIVKLKEDAVFTRLKRARQKLKNLLEEKE